MRPRTEVTLAFAALGLLALIAVALGSRRSRQGDEDPRRSTYLAGPRGARGFAEALTRLGVRVVRERARTATVVRTPPTAGRLLAVLDPTYPLDDADAERLADYRADGGDLLLAGRGAAAAMRCFGYSVRQRSDSSLARVYGVATGGGAVEIGPVLAHGRPREPEPGELMLHRCALTMPATVDTLLGTDDGRAVAVSLGFGGGGRALLVSDGRLFANRALRETAAGELALRLVVGHYGEVAFDEYHHGFGPEGSLRRAVLDWSAGSPWGWALWQVVAVGLLALAVSGVAFGPRRSIISRHRRSPLEHVRALATALAASRGHDVAVRLLVQGLRRRLAPGRALRADPGGWLASITPHLRSERARAEAGELARLISRPQSAEGVLQAANIVEDLWQELRPS